LTIGRKTDKNYLRYHKILQWAAKYSSKNITHGKTTIENNIGETFEKPAVIICNHQSLIDLMCVIALTPKLIILTNERVWNNPYYGRLIKYANYYPVSNGLEEVPETIRKMVLKGYSVVVFPEGTRSEDCSIQRFHRGAFHLAKELNLDILPVMIHGLGHLLPKKEFMLRKGEIYIKIMNRISIQNNALYDTYSEQARKVRQYYVNEYAKLSNQIETPDYYSDLVLHNYIYKGPAVERLVRKNLKKNKNYRELIDQLSNCNRVLVINCGFGEFPLLLSLVHNNIEIVAVDNDQDHLDLAANCTSVPENLHYQSLVDDEKIDHFDSVVLIKPTEDQIKTINNKNIIMYVII
jgi:1-acyl-sn-glycerol-3-phosphate acyltransferase